MLAHPGITSRQILLSRGEHRAIMTHAASCSSLGHMVYFADKRRYSRVDLDLPRRGAGAGVAEFAAFRQALTKCRSPRRRKMGSDIDARRRFLQGSAMGFRRRSRFADMPGIRARFPPMIDLSTTEAANDVLSL